MSAWKKVGEGFKSVRGKMSRAGTETAEKIRKKRRVRASWDVRYEGRRIREGMNTGKCDKYWDRGESGQERGGPGRVMVTLTRSIVTGGCYIPVPS